MKWRRSGDTRRECGRSSPEELEPKPPDPAHAPSRRTALPWSCSLGPVPVTIGKGYHNGMFRRFIASLRSNRGRFAGDPSRCHVCGKPADVNLYHQGSTREDHFCFEHAEAAGIPDRPPRFQDARLGSRGTSPALNEAAVHYLSTEIRRMTGFIRSHGRFPSGRELREFDVAPENAVVVEITNPKLQRELSELESLLRFVEEHKRMPEGKDERNSIGLE
jgi:hypothetical protein